MRTISIAAAGFALFLLSASQAGEKKDYNTKIIGTWEVVKSEDAPTGSSVEFTKDGKLIFIPKGKEDQKLTATYKVEGMKLTTKRKQKGNEEVNVLTIRTLNDTTLITLNDKNTTDELKRVKGK